MINVLVKGNKLERNMEIYPSTETYQVRTANLETCFTINGLACTLHLTFQYQRTYFCCNLLAMPNANPTFPSPAPSFLQAGPYTEGFLFTTHNTANSSKIKTQLLSSCFRKKKSFSLKKKKKCVMGC